MLDTYWRLIIIFTLSKLVTSLLKIAILFAPIVRLVVFRVYVNMQYTFTV